MYKRQAHDRAERIGGDGLLVCDEQGQPVLATLGEKLAIIWLLYKYDAAEERSRVDLGGCRTNKKKNKQY